MINVNNSIYLEYLDRYAKVVDGFIEYYYNGKYYSAIIIKNLNIGDEPIIAKPILDGGFIVLDSNIYFNSSKTDDHLDEYVSYMNEACSVLEEYNKKIA